MRTTSHVIALLGSLAAVGACRPSPDAPPSTSPPVETRAVSPIRDEHSYAEPDVVVVTHLALDLALDFDQKTLAGTATLDLNWKTPTARTLVLDSRHNRQVIRETPPLHDRFPIDTRTALAALALGDDPGGDCLIVL